MPDIGHLDELFAAKRRLDADANASPETSRRLSELKSWQAARLAKTYEDLRHDPRCAAATEFFLTDLYGPQDFARRDDDFARAWDRLKRGLPGAALDVLARALELQVLSAELDQASRHQIELVVDIGTALGRLVAFPLLGLALRAAHVPAHLAGFGALQEFLERGFAAFRRMGDPRVLLEAIQVRETALMHALLGDPQHE
jgi:hypothetical protein